MIKIRESIKFGWKAFWKNWPPFMVLALVFFAISQVPYIISGTQASLFSVFGISDLVSLVLGAFIAFGLYSLSLKVADGQKVKFSDIFENSKLLVPFVLVYLVYTLLFELGFILLIIPGLILVSRLFAAPYLVIDKKVSFMEAFKRSWKLTEGKTIKLILFHITIFIFALLGLLALLIGILVTFPVAIIASAYVYRKISS